MTNNINKQNKSELGMNRNDFYEYKKARVVELAKQGASIGMIANDLGMGEKDLYAFLSRNFGGIRRLREFASSGDAVPQLKMASMTTEKKTVDKVGEKFKGKKNGNNDDKPVTVLTAFNNALSTEKEKLLTEFKSSVEADSQAIIEEIKKGLEQVKTEMLTNFKNEIMKELSTLASSL